MRLSAALGFSASLPCPNKRLVIGGTTDQQHHNHGECKRNVMCNGEVLVQARAMATREDTLGAISRHGDQDSHPEVKADPQHFRGFIPL